MSHIFSHHRILTISVLLAAVFSLFWLVAQAASDGTNIAVDVTAQQSLLSMTVERIVDTWPWYVTRASGVVAGIAMIMLMLSGIGFITGTTYRFLEPLIGWATHRALGIVLVVSLALHMGALYFDHFAPFSVADLLIPFASDFQPVSFLGISLSWYVAFGVLAFYMVVAIVLVSIYWKGRLTPKWKLVHLMSYVAMAFVFLHGLMLGTDLSGGLPRVLWILLGASILAATVARLWRAYTT